LAVGFCLKNLAFAQNNAFAPVWGGAKRLHKTDDRYSTSPREKTLNWILLTFYTEIGFSSLLPNSVFQVQNNPKTTK